MLQGEVGASRSQWTVGASRTFNSSSVAGGAGGGGGGGGRAKDVARVNNVARRLKNIAWTVTGICCAHDVQEGL